MKGLFKYNDSANWYFRYAGSDGKRAVVALKTPDEAEAIKRAQTVLGADLVKPDKTPLDQIVERYLVAAKNRNRKPMREGTALSAKGNLMRFIAARGLKTPADVTAKNLQGWLDALRAKGKAQDTLFTYARDVCAFGKWLAANRHVTFNPFENFERPEMSPKGRQNWIRREEFARLIEAATDPDLKFILYCGFHAGFRKAEICAARVGWFELNPEKPVVHIQNDPAAGFFLKDSDNRTVPLTKEFADFLRVFCKNSLPTNYALWPEKEKGVNKYRVEFRKKFIAHVKKHKVKCTPHDMRRSFASNLVTQGVSIYSVAKWLGDRVDVVERSYGHLESYNANIDRLIA